MTELPDGRARAAKIAFSLAVGALVVVLGVLLLTSLRGKDEPTPGQSTIEPAEETSTDTTGAPAGETTAPVAPDNQTPDGSGSTPGSVRATKIAYRLGGTIYVANEDGSGAAPVIKSAEGPYALSPDGRTLAVIQGSHLLLVPVGGGRQATLNGAEAARPVWSPDSKSVLFVRSDSASGGATTVVSVKPDGSGAKTVRQGMGVRISPSGTVIAMLPPPAENLNGAIEWVYVSVKGGPFKKVTVKGFVTAVGATDERLLVGTATAQGQFALISTDLKGGDSKQLIGSSDANQLATWSEIDVSPDGRYAVAMAMGDDGYSRASVVALDTGSSRSLLARQDTYFHAWSADGTRIFLVEGNYFQGESTSLVTVERDGTGRRTIATGAEP